MPFVYSTLTNDYAYTNFKDQLINGQPRQMIVHPDGFREQILIKGGANLSNERFITPFGMRTEVTEQQLEVLERNTTFQKHKKQGFILVRADKEDADVVAKASMEARDESAPYTPRSEMFQDKGDDTITPNVGLGERFAGAVKRMIS